MGNGQKKITPKLENLLGFEELGKEILQEGRYFQKSMYNIKVSKPRLVKFRKSAILRSKQCGLDKDE